MCDAELLSQIADMYVDDSVEWPKGAAEHRLGESFACHDVSRVA
jgi:hypothetical protein